MENSADDPFQKLEVWCAGNDWCPVTTTATLIGKSGTPSSFTGCSNTARVASTNSWENVDGISSKVLSDSLDDLEATKPSTAT